MLPIPISAGYLIGNKHKLELTLCADFLALSSNNELTGTWLAVLPMAGVGYRLTPNKSKDNFRVGLSCIVYPYYKVQIVPWPYISYGVSF
jgi:hypothetical protein